MKCSYTSLLLVALLASRNSYGYLIPGRKSFRSRTFHQLSSFDESATSRNQDNTEDNIDKKSLVPKRKDVCKLLISGIIGTDPKEAYLSNDHYVINFALAVVGHYESVHDWEKPKVRKTCFDYLALLIICDSKSLFYQQILETMWLNVEVWDEVAKNNSQKFRKGATLYGLGTLISSKWIDKTTGEERKQFKHRLLKIMSAEDMTLFDDLESSEAKEPLPTPIASDETREYVPLKPLQVIAPEKLHSKPSVSTNKLVVNEMKSVEEPPVIDEVDSDMPALKPLPPTKPPPVSNNSRVRYGSYDPDIE